MASFSYTKMAHNHGGNKNEWEYHYTGADLISPAKAKAASLLGDEQGLEAAYKSAKATPSYSGRDSDIASIRNRLTLAGREREQCEVMAREFAREPQRVFNLSYQDIVYFDMDHGVTGSPEVAE